MSDETAGEVVRIVVADDQRSVLDGLALMLDLHMPVLDGIEITKRLTADYTATPVVVLTNYVDDASILDALRVGARGYLTENAGRADICRIIRAAASGQAVLDSAIQSTLRGRDTTSTKTGLKTRAQAILYAPNHGLTDTGLP